MGNYAIQPNNASYPSSLKVIVPDLSYINRKDKLLLTVISQEIKTFMLKDKIKLYKDSIISIFSDKMIIVAGGSDSSGCLTKKAFLIKPFEFSAKEICQLPFPVKDGHFVKYINYIYYAGGVVENDDCSSLDIDEGAPILRYSIDDNF